MDWGGLTGNETTYLEIFNWDVMLFSFISMDDSSLRKKYLRFFYLTVHP